MSETPTTHSEREEIEMLLPWYAAGTLSRSEMARVDAYLDAHPDMRDQLALVSEEQAETIGVNENLGAPSAGALDRLMNAIEAESGPLRVSARAPDSLWQRLSNWVGELSPRPLALAAAIAVTLVCIQAAVLGVLVTGQDGARFQTASGTEEKAATTDIGTFALVGFAATAEIADINALLEGRNAEIVAGPLPGGLFRVRLSATEVSQAERDKLIADLRSESALVTFAGPAN